MAAYAAVVSLINLLEQVQLYHDRTPIFRDNLQRQLASLLEKVSSLQNYLESCSNVRTKETEDLESRIADTSYLAEDVIESCIVDDIQNRSPGEKIPIISILRFTIKLKMLIEEMDSVDKEATAAASLGKEEENFIFIFFKKLIFCLTQNFFLTPRRPLSLLPAQNDTSVGLDDEMSSLIGKCIGKQPSRQIISVTGMGGIGKTTLARKVYDNPIIKKHFDICGWVTISQEYDRRSILSHLLHDLDHKKKYVNHDVHELGQALHKCLSGRRYLIILDDMWSIKAWDDIQLFLPDDSHRSRVLVTSRLLHVANNLDSSNHFEKNLLDENGSWTLFCKMTFVDESCPREFEEIGKKIARNCKGLPLTIVVIGGLLAKSEMNLQDWEGISKNISKIVNSADNDSCLEILSLSYNHLPVYLKPCFLYMGVLSEDEEIRVSRLIKLWVAEGFLKPILGKSLEEVAELYLAELIDRNLIYVSRQKLTGDMKECKIHDLLRDLCLRESKKCRFLFCTTVQSPDTQDINNERRVAFHGRRKIENFPPQISHALESASLLRSIVCHRKTVHNIYSYYDDVFFGPPLDESKLLRVIDMAELYSLQDASQFLNSRYLRFYAPPNKRDPIFSLNLFWNIQTLIIGSKRCECSQNVPSMVWEMPQLRHLMIWSFSMSPPPIRTNIIVQKNLQTVLSVMHLECTEEFLDRIPNVKKLELKQTPYGCSLNNLGLLRNLQSLKCTLMSWEGTNVLQHIKFPASLKRLILYNYSFEWDDMATTIGLLPQLEILQLIYSGVGKKWNPVDGQFTSLKVLKIKGQGPSRWNADSSHFPCLEHLRLSSIRELREVPPGIGEIETLRSIRVKYCRKSLVASAKEILEEQTKFGNEDLKIILTRALYSDSDSDSDQE